MHVYIGSFFHRDLIAGKDQVRQHGIEHIQSLTAQPPMGEACDHRITSSTKMATASAATRPPTMSIGIAIFIAAPAAPSAQRWPHLRRRPRIEQSDTLVP